MKTETYLLIAVFALAALFLYFIPSFIALKNRHPKRMWILPLNLFLGVTVFGWIGSLLWATDRAPKGKK